MDCYHIKTYTDTGMTDVFNMMEHKSNNDIIKIETSDGTVHVTNEHSLLLNNGTIISPKELSIGDNLLTYEPTICSRLAIVQKITNLGKTRNNVYDLTTENHHYQAGNG